MQSFILSLESSFPSLYSQTKTSGPMSSSASSAVAGPTSSVSMISAGTALTDEILPNKLPLKRRLTEFRFGRDGGTVTLPSTGKKASAAVVSNANVTFTSNPFAFDKFKDISIAFTVNLYEDGVVLDPGNVGLLSYSHPTVAQLITDINTGTLSIQLFLTLLEQQEFLLQQGTGKTGFFYDGCVVVAVYDWRQNFILSVGSASSSGSLQMGVGHASMSGQQWIRRTSYFNNPNGLGKSGSGHASFSASKLPPEAHKILLKPTQECWQHALHFFAKSATAAAGREDDAFKQVLADQEALLEFERLLLLVNEPLVCLNPSPAVMFAMNALHFDRCKMHQFSTNVAASTSTASAAAAASSIDSVLEEMERTLANLAAMKRTTTGTSGIGSTGPVSAGSAAGPSSPTSPTLPTGASASARFKRIAAIETWRERESRRTAEPIYGIDHRRQFVKSRSPLPPSSFVSPNWRPFRTIRYEREIVLGSSPAAGSPHDKKDGATPVSSSSLAKLFYCVNVFYAPPPTFPPIQLFLQVGTLQDTSTNGFMHRLQFSNLAETDVYLQNLRNLLLIENGNCNLKVITDISTTNMNANAPPFPNIAASYQGQPSPYQPGQQQQQQQQNRKPPTSTAEMFQMTPHQILQLNQKQLERK